MAASSPYTSGSVMDAAAALLNDAAKTLFTYTVQLPYLKLAQQDLEQELNLVGVTVALTNSSVIAVSAAAVTLTLPSNFFLPISLMERKTGTTDFFDMTEVSSVKDLKRVPETSLSVWDFSNGAINFVGSTEARDVLLRYWKLMEVPTVGGADVEPFAGANNYLAFKTAAYIADYIMRKPERAVALRTDAAVSLDRLQSLYTKNNQGIRVRRMPFSRLRNL